MGLRGLWAVACCLAWLGLGSSARALDPTKAPTQYSLTVWTQKEGLNSPDIHALAQTTDGYLWMGTTDGLIRFDGVRFAKVLPESGAIAISALWASRDGSLWVGDVRGRVTRIRGTSSQSWGAAEGLAPGYIESIAEDHRGVIHVGSTAGLFSLREGQWESVTFAEKPLGHVLALLADESGFWIGTDTETVRHLGRPQDGPCFGRARSMARDQWGRLWIADPAKGLRAFTSECTPVASELPPIKGAWVVVRDRDQSFWVGTQGDGLVRVRFESPSALTTSRFGSANGLPSDNIMALFEDAEGNIWVGTDRGLARIRDSIITPFGVQEGLTSDRVNAIASTNDGSVWVGGPSGLDRLVDGHVSHVFSGPVMGLFADSSDNLWMGTYRGLQRLSVSQRPTEPIVVEPVTTRATVIESDGRGGFWVGDWDRGALHTPAAGNAPRSLGFAGSRPLVAVQLDRSRRAWLGFPDGIVVAEDGSPASVGSRKLLDGETVTDIHVAANGMVWVTTSSGLRGFQGDREQRFDQRTGLPDGTLTAVIDDQEGFLWLAGSHGIARVNPSELASAVAAGRLAQVRLFDASDGLRGPIGVGPSPRAVRDHDGRLWFVTTKGVVRLDPARLNGIHHILRPRIETLEQDGQPIGLDEASEVVLPIRPRNIRIAYSALTLTAPERAHFRYRLDGFDDDWIDAGGRREASYPMLPPGSYRFRLAASVGDGSWVEGRRTVDLRVPPSAVQTRWFAALCVAIFGWVLFGLHRLRLLQASRRIASDLEQRAAERLRIAHDLHDTLLQSVTAVGMRLQVIRDAPPESQERLQAELDAVLQRVDRMSDEARATVGHIRRAAVAAADLARSLRTLVDEAQASTTATLSVTVTGPQRLLDSLVHDNLYRIAQEAITNALRHSEATRVDVMLHYRRGAVDLTVLDDGQGFESDRIATNHYGLAVMHERAARLGGECEVTSRKPGGTTVRVHVPAE